tara:strand:- start:103 stop:996 length:894 start_codon:yes stop_codon:yes gene_type:complete
MPKDTQLLNREKWLEEISSWEIQGVQGISDLNFTEQEVNEIYAPIIQKLLSGHTRSLNARTGTLQPLLIGITGSVSVGKSTISNIIKKLVTSPPINLSAQVISTDNFLFPNSQLQKNQILHRKGFPESFDHAAIIEFLSEISKGKPNSIIPIYSHETYDIDGTSRYEVTDLIIIEGVNILQNPIEKNDRGPSIREFLDFSIFIDADESEIAQWYEDRFLKYCSLAEDNTKSFFSQFKNLNMEERKKLASEIWKSVNKPNLDSYIYPSKEYADLIIKKGNDHSVSSLQVPLSWLTSPK